VGIDIVALRQKLTELRRFEGFFGRDLGHFFREKSDQNRAGGKVCGTVSQSIMNRLASCSQDRFRVICSVGPPSIVDLTVIADAQPCRKIACAQNVEFLGGMPCLRPNISVTVRNLA